MIQVDCCEEMFTKTNIQCATFQPLTQHVSIAINSIKTNIHLQPSRSLNRVKQDMPLVPKIVHAQHCYALKGKMKVKWAVDKSMMNDLVWGEKIKGP